MATSTKQYIELLRKSICENYRDTFLEAAEGLPYPFSESENLAHDLKHQGVLEQGRTWLQDYYERVGGTIAATCGQS
ncbi:MAG: hypothetical protein ACOC54_00740 [Candidatus Sumerlaeota bacterium]